MPRGDGTGPQGKALEQEGAWVEEEAKAEAGVWAQALGVPAFVQAAERESHIS